MHRPVGGDGGGAAGGAQGGGRLRAVGPVLSGRAAGLHGRRRPPRGPPGAGEPTRTTPCLARLDHLSRSRPGGDRRRAGRKPSRGRRAPQPRLCHLYLGINRPAQGGHDPPPWPGELSRLVRAGLRRSRGTRCTGPFVNLVRSHDHRLACPADRGPSRRPARRGPGRRATERGTPALARLQPGQDHSGASPLARRSIGSSRRRRQDARLRDWRRGIEARAR